VIGGGNKIMFNLGNGTFAHSNYSGIAVGGIGDLNDDGFLDFLNGSTIRYAVPNGNNWKKIALKGVVSNSYGIGARIEIYGAWGKQIRDIHSGDGFKYMSSLNAHFGIGTETAITQIIIRWPSGIIDTINNPTINNATLVVEGSTLTLEEYTNSEFSLYPIPAKNVLNIKTNNEITLKLAKVFDLNGKLVFESNLTANQIPTESLSKGTYILLLRDSNDKDYSQKFIKE
jgi:hypothetical protein